MYVLLHNFYFFHQRWSPRWVIILWLRYCSIVQTLVEKLDSFPYFLGCPGETHLLQTRRVRLDPIKTADEEIAKLSPDPCLLRLCVQCKFLQVVTLLMQGSWDPNLNFFIRCIMYMYSVVILTI